MTSVVITIFYLLCDDQVFLFLVQFRTVYTHCAYLSFFPRYLCICWSLLSNCDRFGDCCGQLLVRITCYVDITSRYYLLKEMLHGPTCNADLCHNIVAHKIDAV